MGEMGAVVGVAVAVAVVEVSSKCVTATNDPHVFGLPLGDERVSTAKEKEGARAGDDYVARIDYDRWTHINCASEL